MRYPTQKYEPGDRFIVSIAEVYDTRRDNKNERPDVLYRLRHFNSAVFDETGIDKLEPYVPGSVEDGLKAAMDYIDNQIEIIEKSDSFSDEDYDTICDLLKIKQLLVKLIKQKCSANKA